ncbi:HNH endonuclease [Rhodococcus pyridinivorans]|uniref:HNH endonuclease n=1 Tax=Rhodococcus pyridinivorans TaxID=103816 RepID=UPI0009BFCFC5
MSRAWAGGSTRQWRNQRQRALKRDNHRCVQCGASAEEVDHILSKQEGGTDELHNLRSLCRQCHIPYTRQQSAVGQARRSPKRLPPCHPGLI